MLKLAAAVSSMSSDSLFRTCPVSQSQVGSLLANGQQPMPPAGAAVRDEPPVPPPPSTVADSSADGCRPAHLRLGASQLEVGCEGPVLWSAGAWSRLEAFCPPFAVPGLEPLDFLPFAAELDIPSVGFCNSPTLVLIVRTPQHQNGRDGQQQVMRVDLQFHHEHGSPTGEGAKQLKPK